MRNLQQIGLGLELYNQAARQLPYIARLDGPALPGGGPLALMLQQLDVSELALLDPTAPPSTSPGAPPDEGYRPGFVCPADPIATARVFPAPVSYRANTGSRTDGQGGPFAPGTQVSFDEVEAGHGASYTAAFAERLVGTAGTSNQSVRDYRLVPGPVPQSGCPESPGETLETDAGRSWLELGWRSTLYSHAPNPASTESCIAENGQTAFMGASSGHVEGVRVLLLDGSVRIYSRTVAPPVWSALGTFRDEEGPLQAGPTSIPETSEPESESPTDVDEPDA